MACMEIGKTNRRMASSQRDLDSFNVPGKDESRFSLLYNNYIKFDNKLTNLSNLSKLKISMSGANSQIDRQGSKLVARDIGNNSTFTPKKKSAEENSSSDISDVNQTMTVWKRNDTDFEENDEAGENEYKNRQSVVMKGPTKDHANQKKKSGYRKVTSMLGSVKKYMVKKVYGESSQA